jgi:hypothetical protein
MYVGVIEKKMNFISLLAENPKRVNGARGTASMQ